MEIRSIDTFDSGTNRSSHLKRNDNYDDYSDRIEVKSDEVIIREINERKEDQSCSNCRHRKGGPVCKDEVNENWCHRWEPGVSEPLVCADCDEVCDDQRAGKCNIRNRRKRLERNIEEKVEQGNLTIIENDKDD